MSHNLFIKSKNAVAFFTIAAVLFGGSMITTPRAQAYESRDQMLELIQNLLEQITVLQAKLQQLGSPEGGFGTQLAVGDGVVTTGTLKVRREAMIAENVLAIIPASVKGTIVDGPKTAGGYTWWKVNYASGVTGWSAANWLKGTDAITTDSTDNIQVSLADRGAKKDGTRGMYSLELEVSASESDVYIGAKGYLNYEIRDLAGNRVYGASESAIVNSTGDEESLNYYTVHEGETEIFTLEVAFTPKEPGTYLMVLTGVDYKTESTDTVKTLPVSPSEFKTGALSFGDAPGTSTLSIKAISPTSGTYNYGDTLTVKWDQIGEAPKGSTACVFLQSFTTFKEFLFEKCVDVAGAETGTGIFGKLVRTSGYDLAPGNYRVKVRIIGPSSPDGKDGALLAVGKGASTFTIKDETSDPTAGIANVTNEKNPLITGVASGVNEVTVSIASLSGDKVYGSGLIPVVNGQWSHRVTTDLTDGSYTFKTRIDGNVVHEFGATILVISDPNAVARFKAVLNGVVVKAVSDVTKQTAADNCKLVYNDYTTHNFKPGDVLNCYWGGELFFTLNQWKG